MHPVRGRCFCIFFAIILVKIDTEFLLKLQEQVAGEVIDHVYDIINTYQGKGNRWYDNDPMMLKGVELLRNAPANIQRIAALKLLVALEQKSFEGVEI